MSFCEILKSNESLRNKMKFKISLENSCYGFAEIWQNNSGDSIAYRKRSFANQNEVVQLLAGL